MCLKNTETHFGIVAILFHWIMAVIMIGMIILGLYMTSLPNSDGKFAWYGIHKSFGLIILSLVWLRLIWRYMNVQPALLISRPEKIASEAAKWALYFFMIAMPLSGWLMSSAGGHPVSFFGLFPVPALMAENKALAPVFAGLHEWMGYMLIGVIVLHMLGAYKHHFYDKDNILKRMLWPH